MRLTVPLDDEVGRGYVCRLCSGNLLSEPQLAKRLKLDSGIKSPTSSETLEVLLGALGMESEAWMKLHSLAPARALVAPYDWNLFAPSFSFPLIYFEESLPFEKVVRLCRDCVSDDLDQIGLSYWRRVHQLRGVTWCVHHQRPLSQYEHPHALARAPQAVLADAVDLCVGDVNRAFACPVIRRYAQVLQLFLTNATSPMAPVEADAAIERRAREVGLRHGRQTYELYVSGLEFCGVPSSWLKQHDLDRYRGAGSYGLFRATEHYALALALLWEQPDEAVKEFLARFRRSALH